MSYPVKEEQYSLLEWISCSECHRGCWSIQGASEKPECCCRFLSSTGHAWLMGRLKCSFSLCQARDARYGLCVCMCVWNGAGRGTVVRCRGLGALWVNGPSDHYREGSCFFWSVCVCLRIVQGVSIIVLFRRRWC